MSAQVVVGVDRSASSFDAVDFAAREARLRGVGLKVVHAFIWPTMHVPLGPSPLGPPEGGLRNMGRADGGRGGGACAFSREPDIDLVVVGRHGRGLSRRLLGNVAQELLRPAAVPVLVVSGASAESEQVSPPGG